MYGHILCPQSKFFCGTHVSGFSSNSRQTHIQVSLKQDFGIEVCFTVFISLVSRISVKMTSFSSATLEKKLSDLSNTQHSVQTLSLWLIHHRKHAKAIVQSWYKELTKGE